MTIINNNLINTNLINNVRKNQPISNQNNETNNNTKTFKEILENKSQDGIMFSKHASMRLNSRTKRYKRFSCISRQYCSFSEY